MLIGGIAGIIADLSVKMFNRLKIDDPVSAISVHGVCGVWGTVAVALFTPEAEVLIQLVGIAAILGTTFLYSILVFGAIRKVIGVRVSKEVERIGLDIAEHGNRAYPGLAESGGENEESAEQKNNRLKLF